MNLQLTVSAELERRLRQEAERQGLTPDAVTLQLLEKHLPPVEEDRQAALLALLKQWEVEDANLSPEEEAENEAVLRAIDEDRLSDRKLFTDILKDSPK
jgi:hypothetical protein